MTRTVFDNAMTAHVWANQTTDSGRANNGNFYFQGRTLYSYGSHFVAGYYLPEKLTGGPRGPALLNADSYSISTSKHMSYAGRAVSGRALRIPNLTPLARDLDRVALRSSSDLTPAKRRKEAARVACEHVAQHWSDESTVAALLVALGMSDKAATLKAATIGRKVAKARDAAKVAKAKAKEAQHVAKARDAATDTPESILARMRQATRGRHFAPARVEYEWQEESKALFRAAKAARSKGWTARAAHIDTLRKAIATGIPLFEQAANRAARAYTALKHRDAIRKVYQGGRVVYTGESGESAYQFNGAAQSAGAMAELLTESPHWQRAARVGGCDPVALAARYTALETLFNERGAKARKAATRDAVQRDLGFIRAALQAGAVPVETIADSALAGHAATIERGRAVVYRMTGYKNAQGRVIVAPRIPGAYRVAGWTSDKIDSLHEALATEGHKVKEADQAAKARILAGQDQEARDSWYSTGRATHTQPDGTTRSRGFMACESGGAMLRAANVTRDGAGAVIGGDLITSQGASVPLAHAIRVFAFLKLCRANGRAWRTNGKTLAVGHFRVDSVSAQGDFVAGCHKIYWQEVAKVAASLGLLDFAPADTTESREHA